MISANQIVEGQTWVSRGGIPLDVLDVEENQWGGVWVTYVTHYSGNLGSYESGDTLHRFVEVLNASGCVLKEPS